MPKLVIQSPTQGIAQSPHVGFADIRNLDIFHTPGAVRLNNLLAKKSATTVDALVKWIVRDPDTPANIFALDSNGVLYKSADNGATWAELSDRGGSGQGLAVKWGYVFVCEDTTIDVMKISDDSWTDNWQTIDTDTLWHPMMVSDNDGKIYGGAGRYVFSIEELTTFVPGTPATFKFKQQALDLPKNYRIKCLEELGNNLMIGTWVGTNIYDFKKAIIFPWNRSYPSFEQPIKLAENGINAMINIQNVLYVMAGIDGNIYRCDGYNAVQVAHIPHHIADLDGGKYLEPMPGSIMNHKGRLFFGLSGSAAIDGCGIWSLVETARVTVLNFENTISTGNTGILKQLQVGALLSVSRDELLASWRDDATFGIDKTTNTSRVTAYAGYFITPLYSVGTNKNQFKFTQLEFQLSKEFAANEGLKIEYRKNLSDSFVEVYTFDHATWSTITSKNIVTELPTDIKVTENVQFKISLTGTTTTPHLISLILQ